MCRGLIAGCLIFAAGAATVALADGAFPKVTNETMLSECTDCHIAYQPQMLPQRSWRKLMAGLADHFGEELSLDEETRQEVLRYLLDNSADRSGQKKKHGKGAKFSRGLGSDDAPLRITDTPRWKKKHHELPESVWADERLEFKGQCNVCHTEAERGLYDDDDGLRVPAANGTWRKWEDD
jgi:Dihaem cytochrome c